MTLPGYETKYPKEIPHKLWDIRESVINGLRRHPITDPIIVPKMIEGIEKFHAIKVKSEDLRKLLSELKATFYPIGSDENGFWWGFFRGDLDPAIAHYRARIVKMEEVLKALEVSDRNLPIRLPGQEYPVYRIAV